MLRRLKTTMRMAAAKMLENFTAVFIPAGVAILVPHVILKESYEWLKTINEKKRCLILKMKQP
jgi:hypothetical protein